MSKPIAKHPDGTDCYTPNCSKRADTHREALAKDVAQAAAVQRQNESVHLTDIASQADFDRERAEGFIRVQTHPTLPLDIYNYAEITQFQRHWNPVTLACRGLIVNRDTGQIVARPFSKFFNYGEVDIDESLVNGKIDVTDKMDGSLGITYPTPDGIAIATRGSFQSEQAQHATNLYREKYAGKWQPRADRTYLYEIIYPENRIVVSYGAEDDITLLGAVNIKTGKSIPAAKVTEWHGPKVETFPYTSMREVLEAPPRDNREGMVVHYPDSDVRVKYKQEDYVRLHRIVTGVNEKRVWELMSSHQDIDGWLVDLPDEFVKYVNDTRDGLQTQYGQVDASAREAFRTSMNVVGPDAPRKEYAIQFTKALSNKQHLSLMFNLLDKQEDKYEEKIWKLIEPKMVSNHAGNADEEA